MVHEAEDVKIEKARDIWNMDVTDIPQSTKCTISESLGIASD